MKKVLIKELCSVLSLFLVLTSITSVVNAADTRPIFERFALPREVCTSEYGPVAALIHLDRSLGTTLEQSLLINKDAPPVVIDLIKWVFSLNPGLTQDQVRRMAVTRCLRGSTV